MSATDDSTTTPSTDTLPPAARDLHSSEVDRRTFMKGVGTAAAIAAVGTSGVGTVAAANDLNYSSEYVHDPFIEADVTIGEHNRDDREMTDVLQYINDNGEVESLRDHGARVRPQDETDKENDKPYNPVTLRADRIRADDYTSLPRGEEYDDDNDSSTDDVPVTVMHKAHWTEDESSTTGTITLTETESPAGGDALQIATSSVADTESAVATFSAGSDWSFAISEGLGRKYFQIVLDIDTLPTATEVKIQVGDGTNYVDLIADTGADGSASSTIATGTGVHTHQVQFGDLTGIDNVTEFSEIKVTVSDGDADFTLVGLNVEKESRWSYGTQEYTDTSGSTDELDTQTIRTPSGEFSITSLDTLGSSFDTAKIVDVAVNAQFDASSLAAEMVDYEFSEAERYDQDHRLRKVVNFELPTAYDLSYTNVSAKDTVMFPGSRYIETGFETNFGEEPATLEDEEDDNLSLTSRTSTYSDASIDDDVTVTSSVNAGEMLVLFYDVLYNQGEKDGATSGGAVAAAGASGGGGGWMSWFSGLRGIGSAIGVGLLGYWAMIRRKAGA